VGKILLTPDSVTANLSLVMLAKSVHPTPDARKEARPAQRLRRPPRVTVVKGDVFEAFARAALAETPRAIYLVSPWVDESAHGLWAVVRHARASGARVQLATRPPASPSHAAAVRLVRDLPRGEVVMNRRLHAKVYICETTRGACIAVVGSANLTRSSTRLIEIGLMTRGISRDRVIRDLVAAVRESTLKGEGRIANQHALRGGGGHHGDAS
jgi:hypothetical protein